MNKESWNSIENLAEHVNNEDNSVIVYMGEKNGYHSSCTQYDHVKGLGAEEDHASRGSDRLGKTYVIRLEDFYNSSNYCVSEEPVVVAFLCNLMDHAFDNPDTKFYLAVTKTEAMNGKDFVVTPNSFAYMLATASFMIKQKSLPKNLLMEEEFKGEVYKHVVDIAIEYKEQSVGRLF